MDKITLFEEWMWLEGLSGISTRQIQKLLGHSKLTTTQQYLNPQQDKVLEIKNPLDSLLHNNKDNSIG